MESKSATPGRGSFRSSSRVVESRARSAGKQSGGVWIAGGGSSQPQGAGNASFWQPALFCVRFDDTSAESMSMGRRTRNRKRPKEHDSNPPSLAPSECSDLEIEQLRHETSLKNYETAIKEYRNQLTELEKTNQVSYDRSVMTLSGGAIAITFSFAGPLADGKLIGQFWLIGSWAAWALSCAAIMMSFSFSAAAMRLKIDELDEDERVGNESPKPHAATKSKSASLDIWTGYCNRWGGILFILGVVILLIFSSLNASFDSMLTP